MASDPNAPLPNPGAPDLPLNPVPSPPSEAPGNPNPAEIPEDPSPGHADPSQIPGGGDVIQPGATPDEIVPL